MHMQAVPLWTACAPVTRCPLSWPTPPREVGRLRCYELLVPTFDRISLLQHFSGNCGNTERSHRAAVQSPNLRRYHSELDETKWLIWCVVAVVSGTFVVFSWHIVYMLSLLERGTSSSLNQEAIFLNWPQPSPLSFCLPSFVAVFPALCLGASSLPVGWVLGLDVYLGRIGHSTIAFLSFSVVFVMFYYQDSVYLFKYVIKKVSTYWVNTWTNVAIQSLSNLVRK